MAELQTGDLVVTRVRHSENSEFLSTEVTKSIFASVMQGLPDLSTSQVVLTPL